MAGNVTAPDTVALIGFGEVGQVLATDLGSRVVGVWDVKFRDPDSGPAVAARAARLRLARDAVDAAEGATVVISAVTAAECTVAARSVAPTITRGTIYLDLNSVSPRTKIEAAEAIAEQGGRYVEAAVMSPILPRRITAPILLGGPYAQSLLPTIQALGFSGTEAFSEILGQASAAKMCRSVMVKGLEALLTESLLAARRYRVEGAVLESLSGLLPATDWTEISRYMISRSLQHGRRRAEEMREVAQTVADAGLEPWMSRACAERQDWAANFGTEARHDTLELLLDALLARIPATRGDSRC